MKPVPTEAELTNSIDPTVASYQAAFDPIQPETSILGNFQPTSMAEVKEADDLKGYVSPAPQANNEKHDKSKLIIGILALFFIYKYFKKEL